MHHIVPCLFDCYIHSEAFIFVLPIRLLLYSTCLPSLHSIGEREGEEEESQRERGGVGCSSVLYRTALYCLSLVKPCFSFSVLVSIWTTDVFLITSPFFTLLTTYNHISSHYVMSCHIKSFSQIRFTSLLLVTLFFVL